MRLDGPLVDPTSERTVDAIPRLARPATLDGLTVALMDISKPRGNILLDQLASKLQAALPDVTFNRYAKPTFAKPAPEDLRKKIRQENGFVIEALAD